MMKLETLDAKLRDRILKQVADEDRLKSRNSRPNPVVECPPRHDPLEANTREERSTGKLHISFVSWRQRLCDPDNLSVKWLLDCLRYCGAIAGDEPEKITLEVTQRKVKLKSNERTEIVIEAYECEAYE